MEFFVCSKHLSVADMHHNIGLLHEIIANSETSWKTANHWLSTKFVIDNRISIEVQIMLGRVIRGHTGLFGIMTKPCC